MKLNTLASASLKKLTSREDRSAEPEAWLLKQQVIQAGKPTVAGIVLFAPPNKDVGEGLNTAFSAMREMKLKPPVITQDGGYVRVVLKHDPLATAEEIIVQYLQENKQFTNRIARNLCFIGPENKMKGILHDKFLGSMRWRVPVLKLIERACYV